MPPEERLSDFLLPRPRPRADSGPFAGREGSFWDRHLHPPSALVVSLAAVALAAVVALIATVVYSSVDAGRPLVTEVTSPTTVVADDSAAEPAAPPLDGVTPTTAPAVLTTDVIAERLRGAVWGVSTFDPSGQAVEGTAFVVGSFGGRSLLLTSLAVVRAATFAPAPPVRIRQGSRTVDATVWTWQEETDLALLVANVGSPSLPLATGATMKPSDRVYTMAIDRPLAPGIVTAAAEDGIDHNLFVEPLLQGAPLANQKGEAVGMVSLDYNPGGRGTTTTFIAVPIRTACTRVITCGGGNLEPETPSTTTPARD